MTGDTDTARGTLGRVLPGLSVLQRYRRSWLRADMLAGVTVAAYLIPQVMAYAEVAGLAPVAGLWAIMGSLLAYAVLGSSRQLSVGPESTTALMTAVAIAPLAGGDPARYAALAAALGLVVGVICVAGWAARLGVLADLLSRPVLVGYMAGIAVIMIVSQLGKIGRVSVDGDSVLTDIGSFAGQLGSVHVPTLALAIGVLAFLLLASRLFPRLPVPLIGVLLATAAVALSPCGTAGSRSSDTSPPASPSPRCRPCPPTT